MGASYTLDAQNARSVGSGLGLFGDGQLTFFKVAFTTKSTDIATAHGLGTTPDFVLLSTSVTDDFAGAPRGIGWTANATTLTITQQTSVAGNMTVSVMAGNIA